MPEPQSKKKSSDEEMEFSPESSESPESPEAPSESPLAQFSDEELIEEYKKRGLDMSSPSSDDSGMDPSEEVV
jgi:hypothetical protein